MSKRGLILIIENETNCGEFNRPEPLLEELEVCVKAWKKFFPEIDVHAICPSTKGIDPAIAEDLGIHYHYLGLEHDHQCGYYNIPLGCAWAESNLELDYLIHIDLDMTILTSFELPDINDTNIYIGRLNDKEKKPFHIDKGVRYTFESNFMMLPTGLGFMQAWADETENVYSQMGGQNHKYYPEAEEFAIDRLYKNGKFNIIPLIDYQVGARYPLENIEQPEDVKFHHNHIYESKEEYVKWKLLTR